MVFPDAVTVPGAHPVDVSLFVVERYLADWTADEIRNLLDRALDTAAAMAAAGVQHLGSVVIPGDETCLCLFEASDADAVRTANELHELPFGRIVPGELAGPLATR